MSFDFINNWRFAWCALVALRTAQQDGQALSPLSTHAFLLRWLTVAYKQKRFPRTIASDIEGLLTLGRNKGLAEEYRDTDALLVRKSALTHGFSDGGKLIAPIEFIVTGDLSACMAVFQAHALPVFMLMPDRLTLHP